ncbi:MAG TPA: hypothetical protein VJ902_07690 [Wenzhouxiangellaceae bacterium]|nr:hypothetical protein [Wenzhouxiangellaceae bacterium]HKL53825.1 hypothetical protein [Wenzhouxiangellaceae bacterium]
MNRFPMTLILALGAALSGPMFADELPEARALIDRYIEEIGGREAVLAQTDSTMTGRFSMPAAGMEGTLVVASRAPAERVTRISLPGMGEILSGYSRDVTWSMDPFTGPRLIEGDELQFQAEQSEPGAILRDPAYVESAETVGTAQVNGQDCFRVRLRWKSGRETFDCYATASGLLVGMESTQPSPMGDVQAVMSVDEYRRFDGMLVPAITRVEVMGQTQLLEIDKVAFGTPDDSFFARPAAIEGLIDQRNAK